MTVPFFPRRTDLACCAGFDDLLDSEDLTLVELNEAWRIVQQAAIPRRG